MKTLIDFIIQIIFGVKGQLQKGIDIYSAKTNTVIQCKLKHTGKKDEAIRKSLMDDIQSDLKKALDLQFEISRFFSYLLFVMTVICKSLLLN